MSAELNPSSPSPGQCVSSFQQSQSGLRSLVTWDNALTVLFVLCVFLLGCTQMRSTDIWWHLRTGQLILERGHVPWFDWYTFTSWDKKWIDLHWLFQVQVALLYRLGGVHVLVLAKAACLAATVAIGWSASGRNLPRWLQAVCWTMPVICLSGRALVRPEMLTLIFLAIWLSIIFRLDEKPQRIWWLPAVQIFWTNCHGLFVLGPVVGATYVADRISQHFLQSRGILKLAADTLPLKHVFLAALLSLLASLVNPYVQEGALYPLVLYDELGDLGPLENEPPIYFIRNYGFGNVFLLAELGLWLVTAGSFIWLASQKRFNLMRLLLFLGFSHLAWQAQRNINVFALVSGVVLCTNIAEILRQREIRLAPGQDSSHKNTLTTASPVVANSAHRVRLSQLSCGIIAACSVCVATNVWAKFHGEGTWFGIGEKNEYYIHEAAKFAGHPEFPKRALVAQFGQTAVYIFHNAPDHKVFMDGRLNVVSAETEARYFQILQAIANQNRMWEVVLRDAGGNLPVIILDSRFSRPIINGLYATPGWRLVFADTTAAVFIETDLADRLNLSAADLQPLFNPPP